MNHEHFRWPTPKSIIKLSSKDNSKSSTTPCLGAIPLAVSSTQNMFANLNRAEKMIENARASNPKYKQLCIFECKMMSLIRIQKRTLCNTPLIRKQIITEEESKANKKMITERQSKLEDYCKRLPG